MKEPLRCVRTSLHDIQKGQLSERTYMFVAVFVLYSHCCLFMWATFMVNSYCNTRHLLYITVILLLFYNFGE